MGSEGSLKLQQVVTQILWDRKIFTYDFEYYILDTQYLDKNFEEIWELADRYIDDEIKANIESDREYQEHLATEFNDQ
ncbi:MAG: hypothetical protein GF317_22820 [Candidatus Lokiarchaeota archaeon]|nr:hypothetical protein [Candidatus Lokiarchaeota archaeon]